MQAFAVQSCDCDSPADAGETLCSLQQLLRQVHDVPKRALFKANRDPLHALVDSIKLAMEKAWDSLFRAPRTGREAGADSSSPTKMFESYQDRLSFQEDERKKLSSNTRLHVDLLFLEVELLRGIGYF